MRISVPLGAAALVLGALVAGEAALPGLAEDRLRGELSRSGEVRSVEVSAFPALQLLLGRADRVRVRMGTLRAGTKKLADLLADTRRVGELSASAEQVAVGSLLVRDVRLEKRGDGLRSEAAVTDADLSASLPDVGLRPVEADDDGLVMEATTPLLGTRVSVRARLSARDGALVIAPEGLLAGLATITLFDDPRVRVTGVSARASPDGFTLTADGRLS